MQGLITLTTDFGLSDGYVAAMKGVILGINPNARIVDITHDVGPQNIRQGALLFASAAPYFPAGTVHVVVVDPGVGSERRALALQAGGNLYVAPDNGVVSRAVQGLPDIRAVALDRPEFWRESVSSTFHGRDIFAPVAAHLSLGVPLDSVGTPVTDWVQLPREIPRIRADGSLAAHVSHIDRFGNVVIDLIRQELVEQLDNRAGPNPSERAEYTGSGLPDQADTLPANLVPEKVTVEIAGRTLKGLKRTYAEGEIGELLLLFNSSGFLEVAERQGSAAKTLGVRVGQELRVVP